MDKKTNEDNRIDLDAGMPSLSKSQIFSITFAFFGINMAFSLQSSQMSRICQTIGANPNSLGFFFIFPPLMGMIVQPILGQLSDRTWAVTIPPLWDPNCGLSLDHATVFRVVWLRVWFAGRNDLRRRCYLFHGPVLQRLHAAITDAGW